MRKFIIKVEGKVYDVEVEEVGENKASEGTVSAPSPIITKVKEEPVKSKSAKVSDNPASSKAPTAAVAGEEVLAPMPGKILQLKVSEGDSIKVGDTLLILEAMKMENEIVADTSGNVKKINVTANDMVDTGDILMVIG
ncbi:MAG: acetyl-CoA carboxylase biotin carboxyl carrier protein subunit [Candidatus Infernicultor aquiphilus]|uniref:Acetyl-CoA carboxylase biotin carboxyl carrier protein subunit n=1 Tax=Candidatus Infernicultor aquiphilus TaxID=1805029 RepID=A0A2M8CFS9_9BACT|nr:biotin/lipoyl-binding protein [bacterium]PIU25530.1 MAG: acetyl-CoA carboxylase biotin carboxyl carrier protein subunit [Candidatus Atribacteria bacterium CG08_land_8_20_14_0_20_33_29]PIX34782.1 MAG: acetyl-CoA carboxylase biotin carboxyl carrier protein subunit [Candidatus Atribacteria bacterium CG_4_8_14_3_um_filter_34_18]PIY33086.1 MAG: acetyl-CoA carboxylase biotin carboxyl carrier protein subunit [Candidatus Atribacteria bacterium CG_4_10_14_3_um_filter_34_13]PJB57898.1 MAG: acetyl-CoA 